MSADVGAGVAAGREVGVGRGVGVGGGGTGVSVGSTWTAVGSGRDVGVSASAKVAVLVGARPRSGVAGVPCPAQAARIVLRSTVKPSTFHMVVFSFYSFKRLPVERPGSAHVVRCTEDNDESFVGECDVPDPLS